jgi:hypothetical protein
MLGGDKPFRLLSNNPKKRNDLKKHGLTQVESEKHIAGVGAYNARYLQAKKLWGHVIDEKEISFKVLNPVLKFEDSPEKR